MTTSANVTYYEIRDIQGRFVEDNSQHAYCKNTIKDWLEKFQPAEKFVLQMNHPDEDEGNNYSKSVNLKDYLDGKYRHTMWREEDGNVDDGYYCAEHNYTHLKKECVECLQRDLQIAKAEIKRLNQEVEAYINSDDYDLPQLTNEETLKKLNITLDIN